MNRNRFTITAPRVTRPMPERELRWSLRQAKRFGQLPRYARLADESRSRSACTVREVRKHSPHEERRAVVTHARYLSYEHPWRLQYKLDTDDDARAFLWVASDPQKWGLGSVCFYPREGDVRRWWAMQWAWFHPHVRGTGLLSGAWDYFRGRFGDFDVEEPRSRAMTAFLAARGGNPSERGTDSGRDEPFTGTDLEPPRSAKR